ncbi:MAG: inorganic diphosphatase [Methanomassiliicoccales archaeon]|nr:inorganic diphosphatase [Methanomassiliicoccales archaeon]
MTLWKEIPAGRDPPNLINVLIETPKGSKNKYELSKNYPVITLDRVLHSSVIYPLAYGLIPRTYYDDGDPLDAMVMITEATFPGCVIEARPIGILNMVDEAGEDDKILAVAVGDPRYSEIRSLDDVPSHQLSEITEFFHTYKSLEEGKKTEVLGWQGAEDAHEAIMNGIKMFNDKFGNRL